jgi:AraC-like DNA-binding protein
MLKEKIFRMKSLSEYLPQPLELSLHICGTTYPNRSYQIDRPKSPVCCIEYIVSGKGNVCVDGHTFTPRAGDTYCLPEGADHRYASDRQEPWEKIWINLSGAYVERLAELYGVRGVYHFSGLDTSDLLLKLQYYADRPATMHNTEKCCALVSELFFRMSCALSEKRETRLTPVQQMLAYIEQHETDVIRLEQLAAVCNKSPSQAERLFRAEVGVPPYRYVLNRKIEVACQLLCETGMSVRDIASYLSFEDEFYFSGLFRRKTGVSPTQYRKQRKALQ